MTVSPVEIVACPPHLVADALGLVLQEVAPSQRSLVAGHVAHAEDPDATAAAMLFVAMRSDQLRGAAWGQRQPGNTAVFWPPQLVPGESPETATLLAAAVTHALHQAGIGMAQALLSSADAEPAALLAGAGYTHLADLLYLACEAEHFSNLPVAHELEFEAHDESQTRRIIDLIARTYENTLDCPALDGRRRIEEVIDGYRATGVYRPANWQIARSGGQDVGVLLLADHPAAEHWELMYMGLVPEARGRGWGLQITRHAQWLARRAGVLRLVLAVDAANWPAAATYAQAGFRPWDRRSVFVRFFR